MNADGTCCYTHAENHDIDWRETKGGKIEWVSLFNPRGPPIAPPCDHEEDACPAKNPHLQAKN